MVHICSEREIISKIVHFIVFFLSEKRDLMHAVNLVRTGAVIERVRRIENETINLTRVANVIPIMNFFYNLNFDN